MPGSSTSRAPSRRSRGRQRLRLPRPVARGRRGMDHGPVSAPGPACTRGSGPASTRGQATVELVALLPLIAVGLLGCWQLVLVAHTAWSAHAAARSAARAHAVGADELAAARASLPASLDRRVRVGEADGAGRVPVTLRIPVVLPGVRLGALTASAGFAPQR